MCIKDKTTKEERQERSRIKDLKFRKAIKEIAYKDEGELFLKALQNACISKLIRLDDYKVEVVEKLSPV